MLNELDSKGASTLIGPNGPPFELIYLVGKEENVAISLKYRVSKGIDTIFQGEISVWRHFGINL